jgi:predicted CXXCH cytochrome family protein
MKQAVKGSNHEFFKNGKCLKCHDAHGSNIAGMIVARQGFLCFSCHGTDPGKEIKNVKSKHSPVVDGECTKCHSPHKANLDSLLLAGYPDLCLSCHTDLKAKMYKKVEEGVSTKGGAGSGGNKKTKKSESAEIYVHALPDLEKCRTCHKPHFSAELALIVAPIQPLCGKCHDYKKTSFKKTHLNISANLVDCRKCHVPHTSENPKFFKNIVHKPFADRACKDCHITEKP